MSDLHWQLDRDDARFLAAVKHFDGEAGMHRIRSRTGLSRGKANYRFEKLEDLGVIDVSYQQYKAGEEKVAHLTGTARREIERGLINGINDELTNSETEDLESEVQALKEDLNRLDSKLNVLADSVESNEDDIDWLNSYVIDWTEEAESQILAIRAALEAEFGLEPLDYRNEN